MGDYSMTVYQICAIVGVALLFATSILHLLLIFGAPLGELVFGGQNKIIPVGQRYRNLIIMLLSAAMSVLYLTKANLVAFSIPPVLLNTVMVVFLVFLAGVTFFNFVITKSPKEKWITGPSTIITGLSGLILMIFG